MFSYEVVLKISKIGEDLEEIKSNFNQEIYQAHLLLPPKQEIDQSFLPAALVLLCGKFGQYDLKNLRPVALAVELLDLALRSHYESLSFNSFEKPGDESLALIRGDYCYARAISLVSALEDNRIIGVLGQAIADITEGRTMKKISLNKLRKLSALLVTSCYLGAYVGRVKENLLGALTELGECVGALYHAKINRNSQVFANFFGSLMLPAERELNKLPDSTSKDSFREILAFIIS